MLSNMMETIGKMMVPGQGSQDDSTVEAPVPMDIQQSEHSNPENHISRNDMVGDIAAMIINGRRNATDDWIECVYSFSKLLDEELFREATTEGKYSDKSTLQERVNKCGIVVMKSSTSEIYMQKFKDLPLFAEEDLGEEGEDQHSPRAHPLASSSSTTFQWPTMRSTSSSGVISGDVQSVAATKARHKAQLDLPPDVEFPENSTERNAVLKEIVKILRTKRPNSTENWHKACPNLAPRLESMLYKHSTDLADYRDLTTVTERVLQFVSLGGYKKPYQVKVVRRVEAPSTIAVPDVLPPLDAVFSGTIDESDQEDSGGPSSTGKKGAGGASGGSPPGSAGKRGRPRKISVEAADSTVKKEQHHTTSGGSKPSPADNKPAQKLAPAPRDLLKAQQQRLLLLQHAARCTHSEGECPVTPHCWPMQELWRHVVNCQLAKCTTPHCVSSRYVLSHWCNCTDAACRMCQPAREGPDAHLIRQTEQDREQKRAQAAAAQNQTHNPVSGSSTSAVGSGAAEPSSKKRKSVETGALLATSKENIINFGDLTGPAAKRRLSSAGDSVHSGISHHSHHSHPSQHGPGSVHSASSAASRGSKSLSKQGAGSTNTAKWIQRLFLPVVEDLLRVPGAALYFGQPVDPVALNLGNYFDVVKHPMDLGTVKQTLELRGYHNVQDLVDDVNQTFENARTYNRAGTEVHNLAKKLRTHFSERSRKPRFELSAKLLELQNLRDGRGVSSSASSNNKTVQPQPQSHQPMAIYQDTSPELNVGAESSSSEMVESSGVSGSCGGVGAIPLSVRIP